MTIAPAPDAAGFADSRSRTKEAVVSPPLLLTIPQVAQQMSLSPAMIYKLILTDGLPTVKLGRSTRIMYASLVRWIQAREDEQQHA